MVVPSEEAVTGDGVVGGEGGRFAVEEGAATVDIAIGVACLDDDLELFGGGEVGGEGGVLCEEDAARVVGVAVVPAEEAVAEPGHGADFDVGEVGVGAVAHGVAHERVGGRGAYIVEVGDGEEGSPTVTARMCRIVVANRRLIKISGRKTLDLKDEIAVEAYLGVPYFPVVRIIVVPFGDKDVVAAIVGTANQEGGVDIDGGFEIDHVEVAVCDGVGPSVLVGYIGQHLQGGRQGVPP